ncbi:MAG: hypothetical protein V1871_04230 [Planctomycetota bacterium]
MTTNYTRCPQCGHQLKAHQGHQKTFNELSPVEQQRSIQAMTINLKRAIYRYHRNTRTSLESVLLKTIRILAKEDK